MFFCCFAVATNLKNLKICDMSIVTRKQFGDMVGMASNKLSVYIARGKVFVGENDMINTRHDVNVAFYQRHKNNSIAPSDDNGRDKQGDGSSSSTTLNIPGLGEVAVPEYAESERVLKYLDTLKREKEIKLYELKEAKIRGEVVPSSLMGQIILQNNHSILNRMREIMEELIRKIGKQYDISGSDIATYKGDMVTMLNSSILDAANITAASLENIVNEYAISRGVGEKT